MTVTEESTGATPKEAAGMKAKSPARVFAEVAQKTTERVVETQKAMLDLMRQQEAAAVDATRALMPAPAAAGFIAAMDLMKNTMDRFAEAGKGHLDLILRQSVVMTDAVADSSDRLRTDIQTAVADAIKEVGNNAVAAQKTVLDFATRQAELASEVAKQPMGEPGRIDRSVAESAAASVRKEVEILADTQKQFLDIASRPMKARTARANS